MTHIIDLEFQKVPNSIAAYLVETTVGPVLIECGPHSSFPVLEKRINEIGYKVSDIKHLFLSHIHLDHAGAAWAFAENGTKVHVHPKGYKHLVDPSKLMDSAGRIYKDMMQLLWGEMRPIPRQHLIETPNARKRIVGDKEFVAWHTLGHAVHHIAWQMKDTKTNELVLFSGDVAGVKIKGGMTVAPCPPPDINIEDWQDSINLMHNLPLKKMYLTHFGAVEGKTNITEHLNYLEQILFDWANWIKPYYLDKADPKKVTPLFQEYVEKQLLNNGVPKADLPIYEAANPSWMSVSGLLRYWRKKEEKEGSV